MKQIVFLIEAAPEGGQVARALGESIITQVDAQEELHKALRDAGRCHFEEKDLPSLIRLHFVRDEVIAA